MDFIREREGEENNTEIDRQSGREGERQGERQGEREREMKVNVARKSENVHEAAYV